MLAQTLKVCNVYEEHAVTAETSQQKKVEKSSLKAWNRNDFFVS